jgi:hypothetical protein
MRGVALGVGDDPLTEVGDRSVGQAGAARAVPRDRCHEVTSGQVLREALRLELAQDLERKLRLLIGGDLGGN